jgi:hypothetical protein
MRFYSIVIATLLAGCSSTNEPCNTDCATTGFDVVVPTGAKAPTVTGCSANPTSVDSNHWHVAVSGGSTCHVDLTLADGTHRSGDAAITFSDDRCCGGYRGETLDLSR